MRRGRERVGAWTFHSFCLRIIRQNRQLLKLENISVCSQSQQVVQSVSVVVSILHLRSLV
jgi:superfamily I DNA/RNA helicase